ncbi:glycosyltransferase family 4 protein [Bradyrhizobium sp. LjRoot220]|uniref:glycosyltransferase family 4 protein n=1 Tax=Bradyrhizobium sp. LjRoot220 TaxID=3342284 RepID=UPI003ECD9109
MPSDPDRTTRVLHVAETIRGGIATYLNELHPHQRKTLGGGNVHYVIPSDHRADLTGIDDTEITEFGRSDRSVSGLFRMLLATLRAVHRLQPDVVHLHSSFAGLVLRPVLLLKRKRPRIVYCPHGWAFSRETGWLSYQVTKLTEGILAKITDRIICISRDEFKEGVRAGIEADRLVLVHNGISKNRPLLDTVSAIWPSEKTKVLFIGRLDRQKGYDLLTEAARALEDLVDVRIVGASVIGKYEDEGRALPANVSLLGWQDRHQIEAQLEKADLVVIPSRWEAFGLVAIEAMRAAKPIIAFRIGALPEIVEDGVTGVLCEPVSAAQLAEGFRRALKLDLPAVGLRGFERFRQLYDIEKTHRVLNQVYAELGRGDQIGSEQQAELQSDLPNNF